MFWIPAFAGMTRSADVGKKHHPSQEMGRFVGLLLCVLLLPRLAEAQPLDTSPRLLLEAPSASPLGLTEDSQETFDSPAPPLAYDDETFERHHWLALPVGGYSTDVGAAGALLAMYFHYDGAARPYRDKVRVIALVTSKLVQYYEVLWERLRLFGTPLRLESTLSVAATTVGNYCGIGNQVSCSAGDATRALGEAGTSIDSPSYAQEFEQYYRFQVLRPTLRFFFRYAPEHRGVEYTFGVEFNLGLSRSIEGVGPFPNSLYASRYPDGEEGLLSTLQIGVFRQVRDHERRPTSGYVLAVDIRSATQVWGSHWNYAAINLAAAGYFPVGPSARFVLATRVIFDVQIGNPPTTILGSVAGFWNDMAFGGQTIGRGVRGRRFIGRVKLLGQLEGRLSLFSIGRFEFVALGFLDVGWIGESLDEWGGKLAYLNRSFGAGLALYWGQDFILRFDTAFSVHEHYSPFFYLALQHPF